ncbi:MAG: TonB-dependent receptor [Ferruginibacter sp.]
MEKYLLHINEPCTENWQSMTTVEQGKFCSSCNKTVFDFTTATDNEIVKHIEAIKGELFCGRFENNQLDRWIERSDTKRSNPRLYKFLISFMLLGVVQGANAQTKPAQEQLATQKKLDSLLNLQSTSSETGVNKCDTVSNGVFNDTRIILGGVRTLTGNHKPLLIVDGTPIKSALLNKLNPNRIKSVNVLESTQSTALYGPDGVNGALIVETKYTKKEFKKLLQ